MKLVFIWEWINTSIIRSFHVYLIVEGDIRITCISDAEFYIHETQNEYRISAGESHGNKSLKRSRISEHAM
jgi:hypothetical protein